MRKVRRILLGALLLVSFVAERDLLGQSTTPAAVIDLATDDGAKAVSGIWRYSDTKIVEVPFRAPGADGQPSGEENVTYDISPRAGVAGFDDSSWQIIPASSLAQRRSTGKLCFNWYRISITVPERVGDFSTLGSTIAFETSLDDYAELWVNGELPRTLGQQGGSVVAGWNAANRVVLTRNAKAGQKIQLAIFGANGPLSDPPTNFIWVREAKLLFYAENNTEPRALSSTEVNLTVIRNDPALDEIIPPNPKLFKVAEGFLFTEGPVWSREGRYLLFSDPNNNRIYKYEDSGKLSVFREKSGYDGTDIAEYSQPGSNGLTFDPQGRLTINQHGNRRIIRVNEDGSETVIADRFEGKRLNSPNDLVYRSDGTLFFTDPPFGLPKFHQDPRRELRVEGVYSVFGGKLQLVSTDMTGPNGLAFSPDEKYLYVGNWDDRKKVIFRYEVAPDARLIRGSIFFDMTSSPGEDAIDGIKVDERGNLYVSGPGGLWIISKEGKHLGTIVAPLHPHNLAWGDVDRQTLYLTAQSGLYKIRLKVRGAGIPR